ncbi:MAG: YHS domain-containing protein [Desulfofustis sp.]|nr:YHS domain-containing protein [Desulfofustis sp.]
MGPLRILILAALLYIGYRLIMRSLGKGAAGKDGKDTSTRQEKTEQLTDVLVEDPVCHRLVPKGQAVTVEQDGKTHYFCSKECSAAFLSEKGEQS